jgi:hypothetical protein
MQWLIDAAAVAGMFILRVGIPIAITLVVAYALKRLDAKWQAEARQKSASLANGIVSGCKYAGQTNAVCWVVRRQAEGHLAAECRSCKRFALRKVA